MNLLLEVPFQFWFTLSAAIVVAWVALEVFNRWFLK